LFVCRIKQNVRIKTCLGTNTDAVKTQIWTALVSRLILRYLGLMPTFAWSLSNLAAIIHLVHWNQRVASSPTEAMSGGLDSRICYYHSLRRDG